MTEIGDNKQPLLETFLSQLADSIDPEMAKSAMWVPNEGAQTLAYYSEADELFYGGAAGGGKMLINGTPVLTPFGWEKCEELKRDDFVIAVDGTPARIVDVYPHTDKELYEFTFADGASVTVSDDHLWAYWKAGECVKSESSYFMYSPGKGFHWERTWRKVEVTSKLYKYHKEQECRESEGKRPYWIITPLSDPVQYDCQHMISTYGKPLVDPYLMGLLLGDGFIGDGRIEITSVDGEIKSFLDNRFPGDIYWDSIKRLVFRGKSKSDLRSNLQKIGLWNCNSLTKFIPDVYLFASVEDRIAFIQGLIDTDGYVDDMGHISYATVSERLAKDVQYLARSLGCEATIWEKEAGCENDKGEYIECNLAYNVYIQGGEVTKQFARLSRKRDRIRSFDNSEVGRRVVSIEKVGRGDGVCFAIDHPKGLHVVQDFVVTHNSDLIIGYAITSALSTIIYRREFPQFKAIIDRMNELLSETDAQQNQRDWRWTNIPGGRMVELGSVPGLKDVTKYQGRPHDFIGFDEISNFLEAQYTFLIGWNRTSVPGQRTRIIAAGNPPTSSDGEWVIRRWAAWLDPNHSNPAEPGELRWYASLGGKEQEFEEYREFDVVNDKGEADIVYTTSRTFIPARVDDNPYYGAEYKARLQSLPYDLRQKMLYGDFGSLADDDAFQVIPSEFVRAARDRWNELELKEGVKSVENVNPAFGVDPSEGGDNNALVKVTSNVVQWVKYLEKEGNTNRIADWVVNDAKFHRTAPIAVDAIGVGVGLHYRLQQLGYRSIGVKVSSSSKHHDRTGTLEFYNLRAYLWWLVRDALDPDGTIKLALCPDSLLERELLVPRWQTSANGRIQIESKDSMRQRMGRSPDAANALMLALYVSQVRRPPLRMV